MPKSQTKSWKLALDFAKGCDVNDGLLRIAGALAEVDRHFEEIPGLDARGAADLRLVCDEIGSNVVRYSVPHTATRLELHIDAEEKGVVRLRLIDDGGEFNPLEQERPYLGGNLDKRRVGGLGLYFIRTLFPRANYRRVDGRNITEVEYRFGKNGRGKRQRPLDN